MEPIKFRVIKVHQPIGDFYIASLPCHIIANIATADVRRMEARDVENTLAFNAP